MNRIVLDTENTGSQRDKAAPFNLDNKCCVMGFKNIDTQETTILKFEYDEEPYANSIQKANEIIESADVLIGFNLKYDLHWLRRYGIVPRVYTRLFDCQLAYFLLIGQRKRYPSLSEAAEYFGVAKKLDIVKTEYWDKGLDTDEVPYPILTEYLEQDLVVTEQVYLALQATDTAKRKVLSIANQDIRVLAEMEWNGMLMDREKSLRYEKELAHRIEELDYRFKELVGCGWININSGDHLSAVLYGGTIYLTDKEEYVFKYKDGREAVKTRIVEVPFTFPQLFVPLEGSNLAKEGFYATNQATLIELKQKEKGEKEEVLDILLTRAKLEKRRGTYYAGLPKLLDAMSWSNNIIHGNLNQCVVVTGRLSSDRPNLQNIDGEVKEIFVSRYRINEQ
jgi:DNA polymerase-1